ncbi:hypothetical protein [Streptomyces sp. BE133]|uniref:hypothetical protein n=1 Tax=Streptomyces sp. BE133 TaxID=3002523 RepID=UPI002E79D183|nr:hypothetical protein [Streptomyces sp. BE133]MEE1806350.1 hypothetical protein [Streptomyces sp. BE133]
MTTVTAVALHDLTQAFDNIAVSDDSNPQPGDVDGAQSSFFAEGHAAAGAGAGADGSVGSDGLTFNLPTDFVGTEDNALAHGQLAPPTGHASRVGLLMTATYARPSARPAPARSPTPTRPAAHSRSPSPTGASRPCRTER